MTLLLHKILPFELTNANAGRGHKWFKSANVRKEFEKNLRLLGYERKPFKEPVRVAVTRILGQGQRIWDSSSVGRGNYKELEDALVAIGWFHDDSPKFITETRFYQDASRRCLGSSIEIQIYTKEDTKL